MKRKTVQQVARVLRVLVNITFICNLLVLPFVPGLVGMKGPAAILKFTSDLAWYELPLQGLLLLPRSWKLLPQMGGYEWMLVSFLLFCGICTAILIWQGRRVLNTILAGNPFCHANAGNLKRAAVCCFCISIFALVRVLWSLWYFQSIQSLLTYNALFVPVFVMAGLLCLVMSALFRQAAEMKAEQDLTI